MIFFLLGISIGILISINIGILYYIFRVKIDTTINNVKKVIPSNRGGFIETTTLSEHINKILHE